MIKYHRENRNAIIQSVEIDLTGISAQSRRDLKHKITECLKNDKKYRDIFKFEGENKLVYETEVLIPKVNENKLNLLLVVGNPAVHSVAEGMPFSYEGTPTGKRREHRFWRALRDCEILKFDGCLEKPAPEHIEKINDGRQRCLLKGEYKSDFNIFLLPYFSFPTPASRECSGVSGIRKIARSVKERDIFEEMKKFEFQRFEKFVLCNDIKNVICFQKTDSLKGIRNHTKNEQICNILNNPVYKLGDALSHVTLYSSKPTRSLHTDEGKKILKGIIADIKDKNNIG